MTRFALLTVIVAVASGCVSTQRSSLERRLRTLEDENFALREQITADTDDDTDAAPVATDSARQDESAPVASAPAASDAVEERTTPDISRVTTPTPVPVTALRPPTGPPQHWVRAYRPPQVRGCDSGTFSVQFRNDTDWYLEVYLDGRRIRVFGADGTLPHIPPGQSAYGCLDSVGTHAIMGRAFARRASELIEVDDFSFSRSFGASPRRGSRHVVALSAGLFRWNPAR